MLLSDGVPYVSPGEINAEVQKLAGEPVDPRE
jgi:hypothetical protein